VTRDEFEHRVLSLWMTTRMPLTRANLQFVTGVPRARLEKWLDQLVADNIVDVDSDDAGELIWTVRGADRPARGPEKAEEVKKLADLRREVQGSTALVKMGAAASSLTRRPAAGEPHKSLIASGLLSFFFGPLGWLYAAPPKEAGLAIAAYVLLCAILPHFLLAMLFGVLNPVSAGVGVLYAWRYNQKGERTPLLPSDPKRALPPHD
jgi:hypothetical protein